MKVLYVNHGHDERCGVHDLGRRHAAAITGPGLEVTYTECNSITEYKTACVWAQPDVVIINYLPGIMPWVDVRVEHESHRTVGVVHNYQESTIGKVARDVYRMFDYVLALDPGLLTSNPKVLLTDRPIPAASTVNPGPPGDGPVRVGSFGFAFPHKNFPAVAAEIALTVDEGVFDLHMPEAFFNGANGEPLYTADILAAIRAELRKPGLELVYTSGHLPEQAIVDRLAGNHVNCLLYQPGQHNAGLSSALDYLVAARRPILVTDCNMFQHMARGLSFFPDVRLGDILDDWERYNQQADDLYNWASGRIQEQTLRQLERVR